MRNERRPRGTRSRPSYRARRRPPRERGFAMEAGRSGRRAPTGRRGPVARCVMECHEMSCSAYARFICCSRFRHEVIHSSVSFCVLRSPSPRPRSRGPSLTVAARWRGRRMDPGSPLRSGRGDGCALRSSFLLAPTGSGSLFRAYPARAPAPARARVGAGAVRAPDCAREAEDARLPSASHVFSETGAARPRGTRGRGSGVRFPGDHHTTIRQMSRSK